ncbi:MULTISPECIES: helix-turn-helix transcriptional regulator [Methanocorpusculum]|jgi:putative transcriptional regulator|uniref:helix-turn-helix transcriptional regulator n=1 Tax=Methanocorpusculum TaxID=2192 RepID=UPI0005B2A299|nr:MULTISPECIES: helix-turn-helix transcriptional regulator [Methanocorpusculum]NLC90582.1 helix-turn-helix transcriptional regulator [Methanocorpusculum parvum]MDD2803689.1 helix-turn-helix transcriptional regulator [Methanocorpusculum sp.]MEA5086830.1 helix-turn-helix transcriptional regulator [Methanocorpusculum sp.]HJJ34505.1 helix-turn-helix transcriptional regulator [Methanocorpusculum sp.]HJJ37643.1 helix-turn-helix transcriptional regulator [Methanocorpusculum sp.]
MKNRIKELRAARDLTQAELAEIISVSSRTIISLEKGQYNPSVLLAHKLSLVFDCPIEEVFLFGEEDGI